MARWLDHLRQSEEAQEDFITWLRARRDQAQRQQDAAPDWASAQRALGAKESLDNLLTFITLTQQEDVAYARLSAPR